MVGGWSGGREGEGFKLVRLAICQEDLSVMQGWTFDCMKLPFQLLYCTGNFS